MNRDEEKIRKKLEKLLALAGSSNEHEANAAMVKAIELSVAHNIELSRVANRPKDQMVQETNSLNSSRLPITDMFVRHILTKFFNVRIIGDGSRNSGRKLVFVGKKDDVDAAKFLYSYLTNTFMNLWYKYYKNNPHLSVKTARMPYFSGLRWGLDAKLQEAKNAVESAIDSDESARYHLMVVDDVKELDSALTSFFPKLVYTTKKVVVNNAVLHDGIKDGREINVHAGLGHSKTCHTHALKN